MKKGIIVVLIILLGIGTYFGYYAMQRKIINMRLELIVAACNPVSSEKTPEMIALKKQLCAIVEEENAQFRQAARTSKTDKEFRQKAQALLDKQIKEDRAGKLIAQYQANKQASENK